MTIGDLLVRVGADIAGFKSAMGDVSSALASVSNDANAAASKVNNYFRGIETAAGKLTSVGTALTAAITLPLAGVGIAAIKTAGELEQNSIAFKTLMGSAQAASQHLAALRDFAQKTPFQFNDLVLASKRMQALGFESKEVLPTLRTIGDAAAALGMGAEGVQRIVTALGQMKAKGMVQAEEMRQLAEAGIPAWQILAKTLNTDVAGAMKAVEKRTVEAATAIPAILAGMNEKFGGLMAQQSQTLLGQWSNLKDQIVFTLTDIGTALMPIAKNMMENVITPTLGVVKDLASWFGKLPEPVQNTALAFAGLAAAIGPVMFIVGKFTTTMIDMYKVMTISLIPGFVGLTKAIATLGTSALSQLVTQFAGVGAGYTAMLATGVLRVAGWVGLAIAIYELIRAYQGLQEAQAGMEAATKTQQDSLLKLEVSLKRQGADISELQKQYSQGKITWTQYMQALRDISIELGKNAKAHGTAAAATQHTTLSAKELKAAFHDLGLKDLRTDINEAVVAFQRLASSGMLTKEQMLQAALHIGKLRFELAELGKQKVDLLRITPAAPSIDTLRNLPAGIHGGVTQDDLAILPQYNSALQLVRDTMGALATATANAQREAGYLTSAYHYFRQKTPQELEDLAKEAETQWREMVKSGTAAPDAILSAWKVMFRAQIDAQLATGKITKQQYDEMVAQLGHVGEAAAQVRQHAWSAAQEMQRAMASAFDSTYRALARSIVDWKDWGKNLKDVVLNLGEDMLAIMLKSFFKPLQDQLGSLAGKIGGALGGIFGSGGGTQQAGQAAGSVAGAGGSAAGGVGSALGGLSGALTAIGSIGSLATGVVGLFQNMGMNKSLDVLVNHTLRIFNIVDQMLGEMYEGKGQLFAKLDDMWRTLLNTYDLLGRGITVSGLTLSGASVDMSGVSMSLQSMRDAISDNVGRTLLDIKDILGQGIGGGETTINVYVQGSPDTKATADAVIDALGKRLNRTRVYASQYSYAP